jgi:hypothetical protein
MDMEDPIVRFERALKEIEARNQRVEANKAWEVSYTRRGAIALTTYCIAAAALVSLSSPRPLLDACIPVIGYIISTLSLPFLKKQWLKRRAR